MSKSLYQPLDNARFEVRLLEISTETVAEDTPLSFRLLSASLVVSPEYHAVSYCWGDPNLTETININGKSIRVTVNLEAALRGILRHGFTRVWVDAICINQSDAYERTAQIARMGQVFSQATAVIAWLGKASPSSDQAIYALGIAAAATTDLEVLDAASKSWWSREDLDSTMQQVVEVNDPLESPRGQYLFAGTVQIAVQDMLLEMHNDRPQVSQVSGSGKTAGTQPFSPDQHTLPDVAIKELFNRPF